MYSQDEVNKYDTSRFEIIRLDEKAHIIKDRKTGIVGMNFWQDAPMKEQGIKSYSTLSLLMKDSNNFVDIWVSDSTQLSNYKSIFEIDGKYKLEDSSSENITVKSEKDKTKIEIDLRNNGASEHIRLKKL